MKYRTWLTECNIKGIRKDSFFHVLDSLEFNSSLFYNNVEMMIRYDIAFGLFKLDYIVIIAMLRKTMNVHRIGVKNELTK